MSVEAQNRQQSMSELYRELYVTKKQLREKTGDKIYMVVRRFLIFVVIILFLLIIGSVFFIINRSRINDFSTRVKKVFSEQEFDTTDENAVQDEELLVENMDIESEKGAKQKELTEAEALDENQKENEMSEATPAVDVQVEETQRLNDDSIDDNTGVREEYEVVSPEVEYAVMVVSQGNLNGISLDYTVDDILMGYSDTVGQWTGRKDENGNLYVVFSGTKQGSSFTLEFQVFEDDTFTLVGATQEGAKCEKYATFFQSILDEQGLS